MDVKVHMEMNILKIGPIWIPLIPQFKNLFNSYAIIHTLNTASLCQHYEYINHDHNLHFISYVLERQKYTMDQHMYTNS